TVGTVGSPRSGSAETPPGGPQSTGTSGTNVREGRELAGLAAKENFSTGTIGPSGREGRGKP
ncbi:hypothetical protein KI387_009751, partial [Taxus chinensis]